MKILIIGVNYSPEISGIAPYTTAMAEGLQSVGHQVRVSTGIPHYPQWSNYTNFRGLCREESIRGVTVRRVRHVIGSGGMGLSRIMQEVTFGLGAALSPWHRPDVVLCVSPALISTGIQVLRSKLPGQPPVTVWVQDLYSNGAKEIGGSDLKSRLLLALESRILKAADGVLVIHERFRRHVVDDLGVDDAKVCVSRNWSHIDISLAADPAEVRRKYFGDARLVAIHTGNMGAKQGLENIVEAARLADEKDSDVVFGLVGNGSRHDALVQAGRGVKHLVFVPSLDDSEYAAMLQCADVLIVNEKPGLRESAVPSKLTSYFIQGKPVVAATEADSATADEVRVAQAGPIIAPGDPATLLAVVEDMAGSVNRAGTYGANARRFAEENFAAVKAVARVSEWLSHFPRRQFPTLVDAGANITETE
ncbi:MULTISPECIES: glycosyltransferase family 4 protein [unclassified Luteococcus]|uniref:glycosyltransferase family 4 protein n=1 Tax=unclassified Luteococcus TaxID=2639923 RepID=UPI00313E8248